jgi:hypothetical protein
MRPPSTELLLEALAEALETMAFVSPEPLTEDVPAPERAECLTIRWSGPSAGQLQLATPRSFGELLAATILVLEPGAPEAAQRAVDALQELCNITTGALLSRLCDLPDDAPEMSLPGATVLTDAAAWRDFVGQPQTTVLLAEGYPLAVRIQEAQL